VHVNTELAERRVAARSASAQERVPVMLMRIARSVRLAPTRRVFGGRAELRGGRGTLRIGQR
jgi:hypothetical protein